MARPERFELPTAWFVARYSIQLSYGRDEQSAAAKYSLFRQQNTLHEKKQAIATGNQY